MKQYPEKIINLSENSIDKETFSENDVHKETFSENNVHKKTFSENTKINVNCCCEEFTNEYVLNILINACIDGNLEIVKTIIEKNNLSDHYNSILNIACKYNYINIVNYLLSLNNCNIDISNNNEVPFLIACEYGNLELVKCIISNKMFILNSKYLDSEIYICEHAFGIVCKNGHIDIAEWLLNINPTLNIHINNDYALQRACYSGQYNMVKWLLNIKKSNFNLSLWKYEIFINTYLLRYIEICELLIYYDKNIINKYTVEKILYDACHKNKIETVIWIFNIIEKYQIHLHYRVQKNINDNISGSLCSYKKIENIEMNCSECIISSLHSNENTTQIDYYKLLIFLCINNNDEILTYLLKQYNVHKILSNVDIYKLFCISCINKSKKTASLLLDYDNSIKNKINRNLYNKCDSNITEWLKNINDMEDNKIYNCFFFC